MRLKIREETKDRALDAAMDAALKRFAGRDREHVDLAAVVKVAVDAAIDQLERELA